MKVTNGMKITIVDGMGTEVSGGFLMPEDATSENVTDEQALILGKRVVQEYFRVKKEMEEFEQKLLDNCTCFWKDKTDLERITNRCHSSECASWEMD